MDILYACDENYLRHAAASMVSLCESHRDKPNVRLHLLSNGAKPESIAKLKDMLAVYGRELHVWELEDIRRWFDFEVFVGGFTLSTWHGCWWAACCRPRCIGCCIWTATPSFWMT